MRIAVFKPLVLLITAIAAMSAVMSAEAVVAAPKKGKGASVRVVGKVKDAESGELLEYVTVYSKRENGAQPPTLTEFSRSECLSVLRCRFHRLDMKQ